MSVTALSIAFVAVAFVADGVIFLLLWERVIVNELSQERKLIDDN